MVAQPAPPPHPSGAILTVRAIANHFGLPPAFVQAVMEAEGGSHALVRAVQRTKPQVKSLAQALDVVCRGVVQALAEWTLDTTRQGEFIHYLGLRMVPAGSPEDASDTWARTVEARYERLIGGHA